jgi:hypothetical protein
VTSILLIARFTAMDPYPSDVVVPRDLVKSREFFVAFPEKFSGFLQERPLHFTVAEETTIITRPRSLYILPAILGLVLTVLIFGDVGNAQDAQSETGTVRKFGMKFVIEKK